MFFNNHDDDDDDIFDYSLNFKSKNASEIQKEKLIALSKKPVGSLKNHEIFELIKNNIETVKLIPLALKIIEQKSFIDFDNPNDNAWSILEKQAGYFSKNSAQREKFRELNSHKENRGNCINKNTGKTRKSYPNENYAKDESVHLSNQYGDQSPYNCSQCGEWHLAPTNRITPNKTCLLCTDSLGGTKQLYLTEHSARQRAKIIYNESGIHLSHYKCPHQNGWHLTKLT